MAAADNNPKDPGRERMSRALGAAFLSHQVAELETRVGGMDIAGSSRGNPRGRGRGRGEHRGRGRGRGRGTHIQRQSFSEADDDLRSSTELNMPRSPPPPAEREKRTLAQVIVLDSSVLVHALNQVKRWCKEDRKEVLVVPLEALNTLDLLKKGSSVLAIRARAASRLLEAEVGNNTRIKVQGDMEFLPWDDVYSKAQSQSKSSKDVGSSDDDEPSGTSLHPPTTQTQLPSEDTAPEWMRRIICCAAWEHLQSSLPSAPHANCNKKVALAIALPPPSPPAGAEPSDDLLSKYAVRASGELIKIWAPYFGLSVLSLDGSSFSGGGERGERERVGSPQSPQSPRRHHMRGGRGGGRGRGGGGGERDKDEHLVEKPANGMENIAASLPGGAKIRVLARGEKLDT